VSDGQVGRGAGALRRPFVVLARLSAERCRVRCVAFERPAAEVSSVAESWLEAIERWAAVEGLAGGRRGAGGTLFDYMRVLLCSYAAEYYSGIIHSWSGRQRHSRR
jgi:hypothetical protein